MGSIYLIRHGQASFGAADYDNLSPLGAQQSHLLGEWFAKAQLAPTRLVVGGLRRHQQTARSWCEGFVQGGGQLPKATHQAIDPRWNEYDHTEIFAKGTAELLKEKGVAPDASGTYSEMQVGNALTRNEFQKVFEHAVKKWIGGAHDGEYTEPWHAFQSRCVAAMKACQQYRGETMAVFSSGGAIASVCAYVLGLSAAQAMQFNYLVANCAVTKLVFRSDEVSLAYFNNYGIFEAAPALLTYR